MIHPPGLLALLGIVAVIHTCFVFARLSRRLGNVTKMRPYYRFYYLSAVLALGALAASFLVSTNRILVPDTLPFVPSNDAFALLAVYLPMALANGLALAVTWRYWGWLLKEK